MVSWAHAPANIDWAVELHGERGAGAQFSLHEVYGLRPKIPKIENTTTKHS